VAILVHSLNGTNGFDPIRSVAVAAKGCKGGNGSGDCAANHDAAQNERNGKALNHSDIPHSTDEG
jgi:hypothetical protein